ncbi:MAG TPA: PadR family transcriptional regulator [Caulobacteraceae bacterium]|nr:PadR family transcriptional regulator [Caulobacteraceae bacterium]
MPASASGVATAGRKKGHVASRLTTADLIVLSLLSERPMHGYELVKEYERQEVADWASVSRPHVYYALKKLAKLQLIAADAKPAGGRPVAVFAVTAEGGARLADALADDRWARQRPPSPFTTWLGLSIHARAGDAKRVLASRRGFLAAEIAKERRTLAAIAADSGDRVAIAAAMVVLAIAQFEVELAWLESFERLL